MVGKIASILFVAVGLIQTTLAAKGHVHVNGVQINKPSGCINVEPVQFSINKPTQLSVDNETDKIVHIFNEADCNGSMKAVVPKQGYIGDFGKSIYIE
ncbi:unnamed protein product [Cunninghamella echinulata]